MGKDDAETESSLLVYVLFTLTGSYKMWFRKKFRNRFKLPHELFLRLLEWVKASHVLRRWRYFRVDTDIILGLLLLDVL